MAYALNNPNPSASVQVQMRVLRRFVWTVKLDRWLSHVGLGLPMRFIAWVTGRSIQARVGGKWQTVVMSADEVMADAFG